jgi:hypothetical protein
MGSDEKQLAMTHDDVGFLQLDVTGADGLHLPPFERDSRLEAALDEIVVEGLAVLDDAHGGEKTAGAIILSGGCGPAFGTHLPVR